MNQGKNEDQNLGCGFKLSSRISLSQKFPEVFACIKIYDLLLHTCINFLVSDVHQKVCLSMCDLLVETRG